MTKPSVYTPPLGKTWLTPLYDSAIGLFTRERRWRGELVREARLAPGELTGVDPDPAAIAIAKRKMGPAKSLIRWHEGFLDSLAVETAREPDIIVSSLVLHQVSRK